LGCCSPGGDKGNCGDIREAYKQTVETVKNHKEKDMPKPQGVRLSALRGKNIPFTSDEIDGQVITGMLNPAFYTVAAEDIIFQSEQSLRPIAELCAACIVSWDLTDDAGTPLPIRETLLGYPEQADPAEGEEVTEDKPAGPVAWDDVIWALWKGVKQAVSPNPKANSQE
jgi:hypothetical protein